MQIFDGREHAFGKKNNTVSCQKLINAVIKGKKSKSAIKLLKEESRII